MTNIRDETISKLERELGRPLNYVPVDSEKSFKNGNDEDRAYFVKSYKGFADLRKYASALTENGENLDARQDFFNLLVKKPEIHQNIPGLKIREISDLFTSLSIEEFARYTERNRDEFMNVLEGDKKALMGLAQKLPLYVSEEGGDTEYNAIARLNQDIRTMAKIAQGENGEPNREKMREYMVKDLEGKNMSKVGKMLMQFLYSFDELMPYFYNREITLKSKLYAAKLSEEDGKTPDNKKIRETIEKSLEVANKKLNDEPEKKGKIWEGSIRPYYTEIADAVYRIKKKEMDEDNEEKVEEKERESERLALGMAAT